MSILESRILSSLHRAPQKKIPFQENPRQMRIQLFCHKLPVKCTALLKSSDTTDGVSEWHQLVSKSENINDRHLVLFSEMWIHPPDLHGICCILEIVNLGSGSCWFPDHFPECCCHQPEHYLPTDNARLIVRLIRSINTQGLQLSLLPTVLFISKEEGEKLVFLGSFFQVFSGFSWFHSGERVRSQTLH